MGKAIVNHTCQLLGHAFSDPLRTVFGPQRYRVVGENKIESLCSELRACMRCNATDQKDDVPTGYVQTGTTHEVGAVKKWMFWFSRRDAKDLGKSRKEPC